MKFDLRLNIQPPCWRCWCINVGATVDHLLGTLTCSVLQTNFAEIASINVKDIDKGGHHEGWGE